MENVVKHYICTGGCKGVSPNPGVCMADRCPKQGQPLDGCDCPDLKHAGRQDSKPEETK